MHDEEKVDEAWDKEEVSSTLNANVGLIDFGGKGKCSSSEFRWSGTLDQLHISFLNRIN
jgi:hypothetical protein